MTGAEIALAAVAAGATQEVEAALKRAPNLWESCTARVWRLSAKLSCHPTFLFKFCLCFSELVQRFRASF